jgi:hypothetical protein
MRPRHTQAAGASFAGSSEIADYGLLTAMVAVGLVCPPVSTTIGIEFPGGIPFGIVRLI